MARKSSPKAIATETGISATETGISLSSLHIELEQLEKEHHKLLGQIKRKRTELKNFVEQMRSLATEVFHRCSPLAEKMSNLDAEIHTLFEEIFTTRKYGKKTTKDIQSIYSNLQHIGIISPKDDENEEDDSELDELFEDEDYEDQARENYYKYREKAEEKADNYGDVKTDDRRKIRQTFLRLAEIFHPDRVTDDETQMRHTEIMKEINKAYQEGDLARLLEIEEKYEARENIDTNNEDDLNRRCKSLKQHNKLLKDQYENIKMELRLVKKTPEGMMVSDYRKASKEGGDLITEMLEKIEEKISIIEEIRDFIRDFRDKKITIKDFIKGPAILHQIRQQMMEELLDEMYAHGITIVEL